MSASSCQFAILTLLLGISPVFAQGVQATLTGRVVDSSNAVMPNVPVQVKNTETNQVIPAVTDG